MADSNYTPPAIPDVIPEINALATVVQHLKEYVEAREGLRGPHPDLDRFVKVSELLPQTIAENTYVLAAAHAANHTDGTDDIQDATRTQKGLMTIAQAIKSDDRQLLDVGIEDAADVSVSWDDATYTLTIGPAAASFIYYIAGVKYTATSSFSRQLTTSTTGLWVFYISSEGVLSCTLNPTHAQIDAVIEGYPIIAYVYWNASLADGRPMYELHGTSWPPAVHHWAHDNIGAKYKSGMALGDFVVDDSGNDDEDAQFSVASGAFYDEDIEIELSAVLSTAGLEIWYLNGLNWEWATNAGFSVLSFAGGAGRLAWNNVGTQEEVTNGDFVLCHVFATNISDDSLANPKCISIQGQATYSTVGAAREGAESEINTLAYGTLPLEEVVPVATVIFQTRTNYSNGVLARTRTTDAGDTHLDWRGSGGLKATGGSVLDHGALAGLTDNDHPQYPLFNVAAHLGAAL